MMYVNVFLVFVAIVARIQADSSTYKKLEELQRSWSPGDRILCQLPIVPNALGIHHHMLVVDENTIIHTVQHDDGHYVNKDIYIAGITDVNSKLCRNDGPGKLGGAEAVKRALKWDTGVPVNFSLTTCNCKDYVKFWADGERKSESCPSFSEVRI